MNVKKHIKVKIICSVKEDVRNQKMYMPQITSQ